MPPITIHCPGGVNTQTGAAVKERYVRVLIESCGEKISAVLELLPIHDGPFVIPIWNSHEGEVKAASYVWDSIQAEEIKITDAWAVSKVKSAIFIAAVIVMSYVERKDET